jgi:hypothetical protein
MRRLRVQPLIRDGMFSDRPEILFFSYMRRLHEQPPISENVSPGRPLSRARCARREAVADP